MYSERLESLIEAILADGEIEENELRVLKKAAQREGEDPEEVEIVLRGRLAKMQKSKSVEAAVPSNVPDAKHGNVMRCPNCGAEIVGGKAFCPECGYNFTNVKANSSAEKLAKKIMELTAVENAKIERKRGGLLQFYADALSDKIDPRVSYIDTFPVPNTREDLLELLTSIQPKAEKNSRGAASGDIEYLLKNAYWNLFANCINKSRISYKDDPDFQYFFNYYNENEKGTGIFGFKKR